MISKFVRSPKRHVDSEMALQNYKILNDQNIQILANNF